MNSDLDIEKYKDAVWDFILEHSDVTIRGAFFVKFHTDGRVDFERRIRARAIYGYHRQDTRTEETHTQKGERASAQREEFKREKKRKHEVWKAGKEERALVFKKMQLKQEHPKLWMAYYAMHRIYTSLTRIWKDCVRYTRRYHE